MNNTLPKKIDILDVTLRETDCSMKKSFVPTDAKLWIAGKLIDAGFRRFEVGTFSHIKVRAAVQRYSRGSEKDCRTERTLNIRYWLSTPGHAESSRCS